MRYLLSLSKKGIVTRAVSKKTGYWEIVKKGDKNV